MTVCTIASVIVWCSIYDCSIAEPCIDMGVTGGLFLRACGCSLAWLKISNTSSKFGKLNDEISVSLAHCATSEVLR